MAEARRTLSEREIDVLRLMATGATNQQIAEELVISVNTVKVHVRNIFDKLSVQTRTEATLYAIHAGLVSLPAPGVDVRVAEEVAPLATPAANGGVTVDPPPAPSAPTSSPVAPRPTPRATWLGPALALAVVLLGAFIWRITSADSRATPTVVPNLPDTIVPVTAGQRWSELKPLPSPRSGLAVVLQSAGIYAIGGQADSGVSNIVERYDWRENTWSTRAPKPTAVRDVRAVVVGGQVYIPGGCDASGAALSIVEVYDPAADRWTSTTSLPYGVCGYALAAVEGRILLFGGWDGSAYRNDALVFTPAAATWQALTPMPTARAQAGAAVVDGTVYVVGGTNGTPLTVNEVYDPAADGTGSAPWRAAAPLPQPRAGAGVAAVGRRVYVLGGGANAVARFDVESNAWLEEPTPYTDDWRGLGLVAIHPKLYAIGGEGPLAVNRAYQAEFTLQLPLGRPPGQP